MKKLLLGLCMLVGVLFSGIEAKADTYTENGYYLYDTMEYTWASVEAEYRYDEAYKLLELVNEYRVENGVPALETNDTLMKIAMQRALESNILLEHESPYGGSYMLSSVYKVGAISTITDTKFSFKEVLTGEGATLTAKNALQNYKDSTEHNKRVLGTTNETQLSIGVGIVNDCAVICFFSKESALSAANNTGLTNYKKTEKVPVLKSLVEDGSVDTSDSRVKYNVSAPSEGDSEDSTETTEPTIAEQKKTVKATKTTIKSVSRKRSGRNNTKITVKFTKKKDYKYQLQYSFHKKFKNQKTSKWYGTVKKNGTHKKTFTIKKKNNKSVWIRVRAYKVIEGKKVYGKWSNVKKIKTVKKK